MLDVAFVVDKEISVVVLADFVLLLFVTVLEVRVLLVVVKSEWMLVVETPSDDVPPTGLFRQVISINVASGTVIFNLYSFNYMDKKIIKRMKGQK